MVEMALEYATGAVFGRPVSVFPLMPFDKAPWSGTNGFHDATIDANQIEEWWERRPKSNIGLPLEANGLSVVDLDGSEGLETWSTLPAEYPGPVTCCTQTGSGGAHLIYAITEGRRPRGTTGVFPNVDLRGPGYIVAPPSVHPDGGIYRWVMPPWRLEPQPAPDWTLEPLAVERPAIAPRYDTSDGHTRYGRAALIGLATEIAGAPQGQRNHTLYRGARRVLDLVETRDLEHDNAWQVLRLAGADCGLPEREIGATLASAIGGHRGT
jgi:hypothetical protein